MDDLLREIQQRLEILEKENAELKKLIPRTPQEASKLSLKLLQTVKKGKV